MGYMVVDFIAVLTDCKKLRNLSPMSGWCFSAWDPPCIHVLVHRKMILNFCDVLAKKLFQAAWTHSVFMSATCRVFLHPFRKIKRRNTIHVGAAGEGCAAPGLSSPLAATDSEMTLDIVDLIRTMSYGSDSYLGAEHLRKQDVSEMRLTNSRYTHRRHFSHDAKQTDKTIYFYLNQSS